MCVVYNNGNGANLNTNFYWSSTENGVNIAWGQYFGLGNQDGYDKDFTYYVRAVRAF